MFKFHRHSSKSDVGQNPPPIPSESEANQQAKQDAPLPADHAEHAEQVNEPGKVVGDEKVKHEEGYCSWCYHKSCMKLVKHQLRHRNLYKCSNCFNLTKTCKIPGCKAYTRSKGDLHADALCAVHNKTLHSWDQATPAKMGRCSWCFKKTDHKIFQKNYTTRSIYRCEGCGNRTAKCTKCVEFSRDSQKKCILCNGTITDWDSIPPETLKCKGWCSWCFENGLHTLSKKKTLTKHIYSCDTCNNKTKKCSKCKDGMAREGSFWKGQHCAICAAETGGTWEEFKAKRDAMVQQRDLNKVKEDLSRNSEYRTKAMDQGVIRPFLLLVAMPIVFRNQVCSLLGWPLLTSKHFGDSHAEAWEILSTNRNGMQARCNQSTETLNPFSSNSTWFDMLARVAKAAFFVDLQKGLGSKKVHEALKNSKDPTIPKMEEEFLKQVSEMIQSQMTVSQKDIYREKVQKDVENRLKDQLSDSLQQQFGDPNSNASDIANDIFKKIINNSGITDPQVLSYGVHLTNQLLQTTASQIFQLLSLTGIQGMVLAQTAHIITFVSPFIVAAMVPLAAATALVSGPLLLIGILGLGAKVVKATFGSSEGRLLVPMILILNQRVLLAVEGINIDEYY